MPQSVTANRAASCRKHGALEIEFPFNRHLQQNYLRQPDTGQHPDFRRDIGEERKSEEAFAFEDGAFLHDLAAGIDAAEPYRGKAEYEMQLGIIALDGSPYERAKPTDERRLGQK